MLADRAAISLPSSDSGRSTIAKAPLKTSLKTALFATCILLSSGAMAADCVTNVRGQTVCTNGEKAVVVNPNTNTVTKVETTPSGVTTAKSSNGNKAAYNSRTGNVAVATTNSNGVKTTNTTRGGTAKTKNGMGVAQGPNGTTCAKGKNNAGCTK
jgi:hypothetical protein